MIWILLFSAGISIIITELIIKRNCFLKTPVDDRWNNEAVYTCGGIAVLFPFFFLLTTQGNLLLLLLLVIFFIGFMDDIKGGVKPHYKFFVQIACALVFAFQNFSGIYILISVLWIVSMTNAFNFIDNMDGILVQNSILIAAFFYLLGNQFILALIGAILPYLYKYNRPKAKIYLGDCGSTTIGFLLSILVLEYGLVFEFSFLPFLVFAFPAIDLIYIVTRRIIEGKKPWIGDTNHLSHLLARKYGEEKTFNCLFIFNGFLVSVVWGLI